MKHFKTIIMTIVGVAFLGGCAATKQARSVDVSGFLNEYRSDLRPGEVRNGVQDYLLVYRNPNADYSRYHKISLVPITVWTDPKVKMSSGERDDLQRLADYFHALLVEKWSKDYQIVDEFGPDTLRIQIAIIDGEARTVGLSFISKVIPQARVANTVWSFIRGKPAFVGEVTIEFKTTDAETGELLLAGVDKRVGGQRLFEKNVFNSWGDVQNAFTYWADLSTFRLCEARKGANCVKP